MNVAELVENFNNSVRNDTNRKIMLEQFDVWTNNACYGYVGEAMKQANIPVAQQEKVFEMLKTLFEYYTVEEAEELAKKSGF